LITNRDILLNDDMAMAMAMAMSMAMAMALSSW